MLLMIRAHLRCWLCRKAFDLTMFILDGANLGAPRYWCRHCTSHPKLFAKLLRQRAEQASILPDAELARQLLARQAGVTEIRIS
jgi:hypothetical protein